MSSEQISPSTEQAELESRKKPTALRIIVKISVYTALAILIIGVISYFTVGNILYLPKLEWSFQALLAKKSADRYIGYLKGKNDDSDIRYDVNYNDSIANVRIYESKFYRLNACDKDVPYEFRIEYNEIDHNKFYKERFPTLKEYLDYHEKLYKVLLVYKVTRLSDKLIITRDGIKKVVLLSYDITTRNRLGIKIEKELSIMLEKRDCDDKYEVVLSYLD